MRHGHGYKKLGRASAHRKALLRNMVTSLFRYGRIVTTLEKSKALKPVAERLITLAKIDSLHHKRLAAAVLFEEGFKPDEKGRTRKQSERPNSVLYRLFTDIGPANQNRPGGYLRIVKLGYRPGDNARKAILEFVEDSLIVGSKAIVLNAETGGVTDFMTTETSAEASVAETVAVSPAIESGVVQAQ
jgi:large subunit ribosomal protein L17